MKTKKNFHNEWRSFLTEGGFGEHLGKEGTPASRLGDDLLKNLDQLKSSTEDPEGGPPWIGADEIGEFIADQGGEKEALAYIEAMRQEIIDLMDDEQEEIEFSKRWNAGEEMGEEEMEDEEELEEKKSPTFAEEGEKMLKGLNSTKKKGTK